MKKFPETGLGGAGLRVGFELEEKRDFNELEKRRREEEEQEEEEEESEFLHAQ